eukprot:456468-Rhodomonas_salina.4
MRTIRVHVYQAAKGAFCKGKKTWILETSTSSSSSSTIVALVTVARIGRSTGGMIYWYHHSTMSSGIVT